MRILVTGGAGFIGSHVVDAYIAAGHSVGILDNFSTGKKTNVPKGVEIFEGSITDSAFVNQTLKKFEPTVVNHQAAQVSVVVSTREPLRDAELNILGTINLLSAASQTASVRKFIYASSGGAMYGNPSELPCDESTLAQPVSPYGLSKHTAERYVWLLGRTGSFTATVLRYSNVYGPRQDPHGEAGVVAIFSPRMLKKQSVTIFGDGTQVRDYVYVADVAQANLEVLATGDGQAFNISTGRATSTNEVFTALQLATNYPNDAVHGVARSGEVQAIFLSPHKAAKELGWQPRVNFKEGIAKTLDWYKEHLA